VATTEPHPDLAGDLVDDPNVDNLVELSEWLILTD
jgi:hypothetical protein